MILHDNSGKELNLSENVTLQNAVTSASDGFVYQSINRNVTLTFEITGSSETRTVNFEMAGPSGVFVPCTCSNILDPSILATQTTGGNFTAPESWQVEVPAGWSFRARVSAVTGGTVSVRGKAVS
ncbi:hypothetical protein PACILC2_07240 [Paenibacillus cisolokensis]|uniref:Uncharacterized protein n=1 Tax=Paenibacillus cisolokensis TaxID=1658519 RepID=A0ABQ4N1U8_9BACL|nr:hypothetical protein [Paenibacillus cisolokensis]GIQ62156.1 hypothetical protein PACILC2_07240 [Paenibacillus cisolokensis]